MPKKFTAKEIAAAKEMGKYENMWVAVKKDGGRETVVASGDRITDAKAAVDRQKGVKNVTYRKIPSAKKVFIA